MHTDICIPYSPQVLPGHEVNNNIVIQTYVPTLPHTLQCTVKPNLTFLPPDISL